MRSGVRELPGKPGGERLAQRTVDLDRLLGGRGPPRADRPDRLVGDGQGAELVRGEPRERAVELSLHDRERPPRVALLEPLADAEDRRQPVIDRRAQLLLQQRLVLGVELAAFGVPEDHVRAARVLHHPRRNVPRVRPTLGRVAVLGPHEERRPLRPAGDPLEEGERREDPHVHGDPLARLGDPLDEGTGRGAVEVHLPVAGDEQLAHRIRGDGRNPAV